MKSSATSCSPAAVALGVLAAYSALLVHASFSLRRRIGTRTRRKLHYLSFFAFAAALVHGLLAGSDSSSLGMQALYVSSGTVVGALGIYRALSAHAARPNARRSGSTS